MNDWVTLPSLTLRERGQNPKGYVFITHLLHAGWVRSSCWGHVHEQGGNRPRLQGVCGWLKRGQKGRPLSFPLGWVLGSHQWEALRSVKIIKSPHIRDSNSLGEADMLGGTNSGLMADSAMASDYPCLLAFAPLVIPSL